MISKNLKRGREKPKEELERGFKKSGLSYFELEKKYFPGSKKWNEEWEKSKASREVENPNALKWYRGLHSCRDILFALQSPELREDEPIRYQLRLMYWRDNNRSEFSFDDDPQATPKIYEKLRQAWEGQTDERYLFKAEMLRNMGKFKESNELLKKPLPEYEPILAKHKKWAKVIKTLNGLKYKKSFEINI